MDAYRAMHSSIGLHESDEVSKINNVDSKTMCFGDSAQRLYRQLLIRRMSWGLGRAPAIRKGVEEITELTQDQGCTCLHQNRWCMSRAS